jgi:hypothetical protein
MYDSILRAASTPSAEELYELSSSTISTLDEIRLARSRLALALAQSDDKAMQSWLALLHALIRVQSGLDGGDGGSELAELLARVGEDIVREESAL